MSQHADRHGDITKTCICCGKDFTFRYSKRELVRKYCSRKCANNHNPRKYGDREECECLSCKTIFVAREGASRKYCSRPCYLAGRWGYEIGGSNTLDRECEWCGKGFSIKKCVVEKGKGRFCSQQCSGHYLMSIPENKARLAAAAPSGEACGGWKGGVTPLNLLIRKSSKYQTWRKRIIERDNHKCQECGSRYLLNVHHIDPFGEIMYRNNIQNIEDAKNCQELWNIDNGVTLCLFCHQNTDSYQGRRITDKYGI